MPRPGSLPSEFSPELRLRALAEHYDQLCRSVLQLHELRTRIQHRMVQLPGYFNADAGRGRLRLRPFAYIPRTLPYRLSWILLRPSPLRHGRSSLPSRKSKRPFKRLTIRSSRDLDTAIHWGLLDRRRSTVYSYHRTSLTLNLAYKRLTAGLSSVRKLLQQFESHARSSALFLPPLPLGLPLDVSRCLRLIRGAVLFLRSLQDEMGDLARGYNSHGFVPEFHLAFVADLEHRYGRLLWVHHGYSIFTTLTDLTKRRLGLYLGYRKVLTLYERERRSATRRLTKLTSILRRVRLRIPAALKQATTGLVEGGLSSLAEGPPPENRGVQTPQQRFAMSWPAGPSPGYARPGGPLQSTHRPLVPPSQLSSTSRIDSSPSRPTMRSGLDDASNRGEKGNVGS